MKNRIKIVFTVVAAIGLFQLSFAQQLTDSVTGNKIIAYGAQPEWKVSESVSTVSGETLEKSFTSNIATTLYGRLPGLFTKQGSGEAGADEPTLSIRGRSSFNMSDITIVIDGLPSTMMFFQQLVPQEIESVTLLKDAAATAIYGQRGANGVLLVTTKRGKAAPLTVDFSAQYGIQQATRLPQFLGSYDYASLYNEAQRNDGIAPQYTASDLEHYRLNDDPVLYPNVNWYDQLLRDNAPLQNYNFRAHGGSDIIRYNVMFNVIANGGLYERTEKAAETTKNSSYIRYNFRTNVDVDLSKRLAMQVTLGGSVETKANPGSSENTAGIFDLMGSIPANAFPVSIPSITQGAPGSSLYSNPWADITQTGYVSYTARNLQAQIRLNGDLGMWVPGLSVSGNIGFNSYFKSYSNKTRSYTRYSATGAKISGEETTLSINEGGGAQWRNMAFQGFMNYNKNFGIHGVNGMLMAYYDESTRTTSEANSDDRINTPIPYKHAGYGGRLTYSFDKRYVAEFSFGYAGFDNLKRGQRFGFFPAGSLAWIISNEEFMQSAEWMDMLKLRSSYGLTGNYDTGAARFPYEQYYGTGGSYYLGPDNSGVPVLTQGPPATPNLTWEKEKQLNVGIELSVLNKFDFSFDYFNKNRFDIIDMPYSEIPDWLGSELPPMNVGTVKNQGFETTLRYSDQAKDWTWFAEGALWYARDEITYTSEAPQPEDYLYRQGHRIGQPFVLEAVGFFYDQADIDNSPKQTFADVKPGDVKYKDQNNDNVIDDNDIVPMGYTEMPELNLGLQLGATYRDFDFQMSLHGATNRSVWWTGKQFAAFQNYGNIAEVALDRWVYNPELGLDTRNGATYPRLSSTDNLNNFRTSTLWLKNGDYLKLRNLEVGYSLPAKYLKAVNLEKVRFYLNGTNLLSFDHMKGYMDPESSSGGISYPALRTFSLGLQVQL